MNANSTISMLSSLTITIDTYVGLFIYVTGVLGSIGNIIVYRSKSMRNRACSIYLLWESIIDFLYLNIVVLTGILTKDFRIPVATRHEILCKFRSFFSTYGNQLAVTFLSLATIDRILLSQRSQKHRQWGNRIRLAKLVVVASFLIWFVALWHRLVWYKLSNGACTAQSGAYASFSAYYDATMMSLIPTIVLIVLAILIGRNVRNIVQRQVAIATNTNETNQKVISKINSQLAIMLFLQTSVALISFIPYSSRELYSIITATRSKSALQVAWESFISYITRLLTNLFFSSPFYVSIVSFSSFRHQFLRSIGLIKGTTNMPLDTIQSMVGNTRMNTTGSIH